MGSRFKKYILPGLVFQSVVIAGGYGTGREIAEFFLIHGPLGGLLAMILVSTVIWSVVSATSFEFARMYRAYEYRAFFQHLLGRGWVLFEVLYISMLLIVMAVIAAAAGSILEETFGLPYIIGVLGIMLAVGALLFFGSNTMEKFLSGWSFVLYTVYIVMFVWTLSRFGDSIGATLSASGLSEGWAMGGVKYAAYNMAVIAAVLFVVRHIETRKEAITAGLLVGPIAMIPGLLFYLAMLPHYPAIADRPVPANMILEALGSRSFQLLFQIVLFGTLIETGAGMIHSINERIAGVYRERDSELSPLLRSAMAVVFLLVAAGLARMGIIALIAKGYGTITWGFLAVFVIPMLTLGVWRIIATPSGASQTVR